MQRSKQRASTAKKTATRRSQSSPVNTHVSSSMSGIAAVHTSHPGHTSRNTASKTMTARRTHTTSSSSPTSTCSNRRTIVSTVSSSKMVPLSLSMDSSPKADSFAPSPTPSIEHSHAFRPSTPVFGKHKRFTEPANKVLYKVPLNRVKERKLKAVVGYRNSDDTFPEIPPPISPAEMRANLQAHQLRVREKYLADVAEGIIPPRKFSLRKQYLYHRNREIIEKAKVVMVIQPSNDDEFFLIMEKLGATFTTAHFRNGLVHLHDKTYAGLREFFKGPIRVLLQNDEKQIFSSMKRLQRVLKEHPGCLFLGGAIDGFAGVSHDFDELYQFEDKRHIQGQVIQVLNNVNSIIPVLQHPTNQLARVLHHHGEEIGKQEQ